MITIFIVLAIMGWVINLIIGIGTIVDGWQNKDKKTFDLGISVMVIGLLFGLVTGWVLMIMWLKRKYIDKHFKEEGRK
jgi:hypothetical protein